ncbi:12903_t:CDS:1, partial [Gigaspora margarita]
TSCVDNCNRNKIQVRRKKVVEWCLNRAEDKFATGQFDPGGPYDQNGKSLEHAYKSWKEKINGFLR